MTFYTFANATTSIPLANLDANFATPITLGNTAVTINGTFSSIGNLTLNNATIASGNITVTNETVTTITSPAATNLTIQSAGTTAMTIDTSQNVGIGTSSPNTYGKFAVVAPVAQYAAGYSAANTSGYYYHSAFFNGSTQIGYLYSDGTNFGVAASGASAGIVFLANGSERMRIDSSGNVGIGTTSPTGKLNISTTNNSVIQLISGTTNGIRLGVDPSAGYGVIEGVDKTGTASYQPLQLGGSDVRFLISSTERMRIDSSGNLLVGTTSQIQSGVFSVLSSASTAGLRTTAPAGSGIVVDVSRTSATGDMVYFRTSSTTLAGYITCPTGTTTSYVSVSDYRLKENVQPMTTGLAIICSLKPVTYDWISDNLQGEGFIAHELQEVIPLAVTGDKDAVNQDGSIKPQGVDYSKIVVHLVAALQELKAEFDAYKASHP